MDVTAREPLVGAELEPVTRIARNTAQGKGIHDDTRAKTLGFKGAPVPGVATFAHVIDMLIGFFGSGWTDGGEVDMAFTSPIYVGQSITARAIVREKKAEDSGLRVFLDVWVENEQSQKVATGTARGLLPAAGRP